MGHTVLTCDAWTFTVSEAVLNVLAQIKNVKKKLIKWTSVLCLKMFLVPSLQIDVGRDQTEWNHRTMGSRNCAGSGPEHQIQTCRTRFEARLRWALQHVIKLLGPQTRRWSLFARLTRESLFTRSYSGTESHHLQNLQDIIWFKINILMMCTLNQVWRFVVTQSRAELYCNIWRPTALWPGRFRKLVAAAELN